MRDTLGCFSRHDELTLVEALLHGSDPAWRRFHDQYERLIYRCIRKVTQRFRSILDLEDEHEIFANLVVQLLSHDKRKLRSFDPERGSRLGTWLGLLATHAAYDYLRVVRRKLPCTSLAEAECAADDGPSPFDEVQQLERGAIIDGLVGQLGPKDQLFVALYFKRGMAPEAVASAMHISVKTVYSKKHKIQARLGNILAPSAAA